MAEHDTQNRQDIVVKMTFRTDAKRANKFRQIAKRKGITLDTLFNSLLDKTK